VAQRQPEARLVRPWLAPAGRVAQRMRLAARLREARPVQVQRLVAPWLVARLREARLVQVQRLAVRWLELVRARLAQVQRLVV